jgi:F0F1-type ATP synthase alpha subunit
MAQISADEITALLTAKIANYEQRVQVDEVGTIMSLGDGRSAPCCWASSTSCAKATR